MTSTMDNKEKYHIFVVSDSHGFIAAFSSLEIARETLKDFLKLDLLWTRFPVSKKVEENDIIYTLPYKSNGYIAYADTNCESVKSIQTKLAKIDLVFTDDVSYWAFPVNKIIPDGLKRLSIWKSIARGLTDEQKQHLKENEELIRKAAEMIEKDFDDKQDSIDVNLVDCVTSDENIGNV